MSDELVAQSDGARALKAIAALNKWNRDLSETDREAKYRKMAENAFIFYRGSNHLFWMDFAGHQELNRFGGFATRTWIQGDLHVENFGAFSNDEGQVVYDINDFDEAVIADYQYDIWRMAISIVLANMVREKEDMLSDEAAGAVVTAFVMGYLQAVESFSDPKDPKNKANAHKVVITRDNASGQLNKFLKKVKKKYTRKDMLDKWTLEGRFCVKEKPDKLKSTSKQQSAKIEKAVEAYAGNTLVEEPQGMRPGYFTVRDIAWRLNAGTGSVGVPRIYVLVEGVDDSQKTDVILDVKLQSRPTAYQFLDEDLQREYKFFTEGVSGQDAIWHAAAYRAMAKGTEDHLGWLTLANDFYSVRERSFFKETLSTDKLNTEERFTAVAQQWGKLLAAVHARSLTDFDDDTRDPDLRRKLFTQQRDTKSFKTLVSKRTAGKFNDFCSQVNKIAFCYAGKVVDDYNVFVEAVKAKQ